MRVLLVVFIGLLAILQYRLWVGDGSVAEVWQLKQHIQSQQEENRALVERNQMLEAEVRDFKEGLEAIEERARFDLGMIRKGETFYMMAEDQ
ncbi:MAG: cell division protein FtsB [Gammaproteobacteria bacterium]|nr:cell division protein FtsB [Gammaproteobacteria bacterium]